MTEPSPPETATEAGPERQGGRLSRSRPLTFVVLLGTGLLAVVASAQPWWRAAGAGARVAFTGTEATGGLSQALAVVLLAGMLLVLVLKARGRRVVSVLLAAVGIAVLLVGALRLRPTADAVRTKIREVSLIDQYALTSTAWPYVFAVAGLGAVLGAVLLGLAAPRWPVRADRFERTATDVPLDATEDPAGVWKALDAGIDPTVEPKAGPAVRPAAPDVHNGDTRDTMGAIDASESSTPTRRPSQPPE